MTVYIHYHRIKIELQLLTAKFLPILWSLYVNLIWLNHVRLRGHQRV